MTADPPFSTQRLKISIWLASVLPALPMLAVLAKANGWIIGLLLALFVSWGCRDRALWWLVARYPAFGKRCVKLLVLYFAASGLAFVSLEVAVVVLIAGLAIISLWHTQTMVQMKRDLLDPQ